MTLHSRVVISSANFSKNPRRVSEPGIRPAGVGVLEAHAEKQIKIISAHKSTAAAFIVLMGEAAV